MKKIVFNVGIILAMFVLTGCGKNGDYESLSENVKRLELTGNLVTYEAYYHNVLEFEMGAGGVMYLKYFIEKDLNGNELNTWFHETWKRVTMPPVFPEDIVR